MNVTGCTILFNIFIYFSSLYVSGIHVPIIRTKSLYICDSDVCHSVWVASGLLDPDQTPPVQSDKYHCRKNIVILS